ncbi:hypothetical protein CEXT_767851 [Caerostris extrusa]|uniref:Uncharacterized protein n=1 Tax=Caerostris extrusa TaxID=172846 RepID=A0AAV4SK64_CAEEX|nr:hypothetical protein CEXT_767851 [Caerostris extrusa]
MQPIHEELPQGKTAITLRVAFLKIPNSIRRTMRILFLHAETRAAPEICLPPPISGSCRPSPLSPRRKGCRRPTAEFPAPSPSSRKTAIFTRLTICHEGRKGG